MKRQKVFSDEDGERLTLIYPKSNFKWRQNKESTFCTELNNCCFHVLIMYQTYFQMYYFNFFLIISCGVSIIMLIQNMPIYWQPTHFIMMISNQTITTLQWTWSWSLCWTQTDNYILEFTLMFCFYKFKIPCVIVWY